MIVSGATFNFGISFVIPYQKFQAYAPVEPFHCTPF